MALKEFTRQHIPPLFEALKATRSLQERLDVQKALKSLHMLEAAGRDRLKNPQILEEFIQKAGLHKSGGVGEEYEWPKQLDPFTDRGLKIWQYPIQFSKYLVFLSQFSIRSYLEIGVAYGGTFVFTTEYLSKFNPSVNATCIDVRVPSLLLQLFAKQTSFQYITAKSCELFQHVKPETSFDLVLVDGDHSRNGAMNDFFLVKDKANIIAFHDIVNFKTPGAIEAWEELKTNYSDEFDTFEFTDQYPEPLHKDPGRKLLGIGVAVKKTMRQ
ncbi:MAG: class I SAM-dependent methyltransferase [Cyanobacteriota bacterium]